MVDVFSWLLVGHLVGDWLLQNDWMARGKKHGLFTLAGLTHFATYTAVIIGTLWLADHQGISRGVFFIVGAVVFISHWLIDATDVVRGWMCLYGQRDQALVRMMVDQTLHIVILRLVVGLLAKL